jgi:hypothetical protein
VCVVITLQGDNCGVLCLCNVWECVHTILGNLHNITSYTSPLWFVYPGQIIPFDKEDMFHCYGFKLMDGFTIICNIMSS